VRFKFRFEFKLIYEREKDLKTQKDFLFSSPTWAESATSLPPFLLFSRAQPGAGPPSSPTRPSKASSLAQTPFNPTHRPGLSPVTRHPTRPSSSAMRPCYTRLVRRPHLRHGCMPCNARSPPSYRFPYPHGKIESKTEIIPKDNRNGENFQIPNQTWILSHVFTIFS
jgi:hypothetical protein